MRGFVLTVRPVFINVHDEVAASGDQDVALARVVRPALYFLALALQRLKLWAHQADPGR